MNNLFLRIAAILPLLVSMTGSVQAQTPAIGIRVLAYGIHYGGNIVYNYKVINNGDTPFNNFTLGSYFDSVQNYEYPQLTRLPLGWTYGRTGETGTEIILASASTSQPQNWKPWVYGQQEADSYYLNWWAPRGEGAIDNDIQLGQTLAGFSVTIPLADKELDLPAIAGPDEMYLKGGFKVVFGPEKKFQEVWGTLERLDTTPPTLSVTLTPSTLWPPNEKLVPVTATITVRDDYDPAPEIKLVSITANEKLDEDDIQGAGPGADDRQFLLKAEREGKAGRIYTVTYSATDASGNKATASATVTVPHDEREHEGRDRDEKSGRNGKE